MSNRQDTLDTLDTGDAPALKRALINRLIYSIGKDPLETQERDWFNALAYVVRDLVTVRWMDSTRQYYLQDANQINPR